MAVDSIEGLSTYLPRLLLGPASCRPSAPHWAEEGTLAFADVSGFTKLSERLARKGRQGAEEMVDAISTIFTHLLRQSDQFGGDVLKFGGDALLLWYSGDDHLARACAAAHAMRRTLLREGTIRTSSGPVKMRMSQGVHTGQFDFFLVGGRHQDLVVAGPAATTTVEMESAADAQEILLSPAAAAQLPANCLGEEKGGGWLLQSPPLAPAAPHPATSQAVAPEELGVYVPIALRGRLDSLVQESEHRHVAVAFMHFLGLDALIAEAGPAEVHRRLDSLTRAVVDVAADLGVCLICTDIGPDGGKFMLAAGAPDSYEDREERMLRLGLAVMEQDHGLAVRMGVNRGPAYGGAVGAPFRHTYSTMGDAVNLAARVMGKAQPGQLLATAAVMAQCEGRFETEPLEPFLVKGKAMPVHAFAVRGRKAARRERRRSEQPLVGRVAELAILHEAVERAAAGSGGTVEVVGDAGMGKSRLLREVSEHPLLDQRLLVECEQYESNTPYFAARWLVRAAAGIRSTDDPLVAGQRLRDRVLEACPDIAPWLPLLGAVADATTPSTPEVDDLDPRFRRQRLNAVVERFLVAVLTSTTLIAVEDGFWMDEASADVFGHLAGVADQHPWLLCVTRRPVEGGLHAALGYPATVLDLAPLDPSESVTLLLSVDQDLSPHAVDQLSARSSGNPLFLLEMAAASAHSSDVDALPDDIEAIVTTRLDRLAPPDRRILRYAAVLGARFRQDVFERAVGDLLPGGIDAGAWSRLGEFVRRDERGILRFGNEVFRRVAYDALPFSRRQQVHGRVGEVLQSLSAEVGEDRLGLLSLHFHSAQRFQEAWTYSVEAGARARALAANLEAVEFYRRAIDAARHLPAVAPEEEARIFEAMGDACEVTALYEQATAAYGKARERLRADPVATARMTQKEGILRERLGKYAGAVRWYNKGLAVLAGVDGDEAAAVRAKLLVGFAAVRYRQGRLTSCVDLCEQVVHLAATGADRSTLAHAYFLLDAALTDLGRADSEKYRALALPIYEEIGDLVGQASVLNNLGINAYYEGRWHEALELYERSREARVRAGDVVGAATAANNIGEILSDQGRFAEAEDLFREAQRVFRSAGYPVGRALATSNLGRVAARAGRFDEASELLMDALEQFRTIRAETFVIETQARLAELLLLGDQFDQALTLAEAVRTNASSAEHTFARAVLDRIRGIAMVHVGRASDGRQALIASVQAAEEAGAEYEAAVSLACIALAEEALANPRSIERRQASNDVFARLEVLAPPPYSVPVPERARRRDEEVP